MNIEAEIPKGGLNIARMRFVRERLVNKYGLEDCRKCEAFCEIEALIDWKERKKDERGQGYTFQFVPS